LPEFYLKGFGNDQKKLFTYDKERDYYSWKSPRQVFFEKDRNTIDGHDMLEEMYSRIDNIYAGCLKRIIEGSSFQTEDVLQLLLFSQILSWRVPANDDGYYNAVNNLTLPDLHLEMEVFNPNGTKNEEALNHILRSKIFKESIRFVFPLLPYYSIEEIMRVAGNLTIQEFLGTNPALIGDSPFLCRTVEHGKIGEFIFPASSYIFLIHSLVSKNAKRIEPDFSHYRDLAMIHQAKRYVACANDVYLKSMIKEYQNASDYSRTRYFDSALAFVK